MVRDKKCPVRALSLERDKSALTAKQREKVFLFLDIDTSLLWNRYGLDCFDEFLRNGESVILFVSLSLKVGYLLSDLHLSLHRIGFALLHWYRILWLSTVVSPQPICKVSSSIASASNIRTTLSLTCLLIDVLLVLLCAAMIADAILRSTLPVTFEDIYEEVQKRWRCQKRFEHSTD